MTKKRWGEERKEVVSVVRNQGRGGAFGRAEVWGEDPEGRWGGKAY